MADIAELAVKVTSDGVDRVKAQLSSLASETAKTEKSIGTLRAAALATGAALGVGFIGAKVISNTIESQNAMAQLEARVKSTGMAAGFSAGQLDEMSVALARQTTYGDEAIKSAQSLLLTFTKIQGDTFPAATQAVANLATAMGGDLKGAALQLGKALQDPEQGLTALRRSGVSFSDAQQEVIKGLFATGREAEAQAMILKELEKEFGGAAQAARGTLGGSLTALREEFGNLFEANKESTSGLVAFIDAVTRGTAALNEHRGAISGVIVTVGAAGLVAALYAAAGATAALVGGVASLAEGLLAARLAAAAFWTAITGPVGVAVAGVAAVSVVMGKLLGDLGKANQEMDAREEADRYMVQVALKRRNAEREAAEQAKLKEQAAALAAKRQADADAAELAGMEAKIRRERELADAKQVIIDKLDREKKLHEQIRDLLSGNGPSPKVGGGVTMPKLTTWIGTGSAPVGSGIGAGQEASAEYAATWKARLDQVVAGMTKATHDMNQIRDNFLRGLQESFARTFETIFTKGIRGFRDLFAGVADLAKQAASQLASSGLMTWLSSTYRSGGGGLGGIGAILSAGGGLGYAGVIGSLIAGFGSAAKAANEVAAAMTRQQQALTSNLRGSNDPTKSLTDQVLAALLGFKGIRVGTREGWDAADLTGKRGILQNALNDEARFSSDTRRAQAYAEAIKQLDLIIEKAARDQAKLNEAKQFELSLTERDLRVRELAAMGYADEADAMALFNRQAREFGEAVRAGWDEAMLAYLAHVQEIERQQVEQAKTARDAADAAQKLAEQQAELARQAEEAANRIAAAQQRAAEYAANLAQATEDLGVRMLKAQGQAEAADKRAFELQQQRERRAIEQDIGKFTAEQMDIQRKRTATGMSGGGPTYGFDPVLGYLGSTQAQAVLTAQFFAVQSQIDEARKYLEELAKVQAAEATAFANGQSMAGASAAAPGTAGSFNTIVSRATSAQGDRMVDELTTARTIQQTYLPYLKVIADKLTGGVNALLGAELQNSYALAGSAVVA